MTAALYDYGREGFLAGDISWRDDNIKVVLVDVNDYTVDLAAHQFLSDVPAAARVATSANLSGKTVTDGVADANDVTLTTVSGDISEALVVYADSGTAATSRLILFSDEGVNLPITPNGGDIDVVWGNTANAIFKL